MSMLLGFRCNDAEVLPEHRKRGNSGEGGGRVVGTRGAAGKLLAPCFIQKGPLKE